MPSMIAHHFPLSHRSIKIRFAHRFVRALKKLNKPRTTTTTNSSTKSIRETTKRYHMVKTAAYASMASAVGSKRAWSRALLWKIRNRGLIISRTAVMKRNKARSPLLKKTSSHQENPSKAKQLQKLVPGGEVMDFCSLLDETAHYIKCLTSQVETWK